MKIKKICIIRNAVSPSWVSCKEISTNIVKSYEVLFDKDQILELQLNDCDSSFSNNEMVEQVFQYRPDIICLIEHDSIPSDLLDRYAKFCHKHLRPLPELIFHLYGDVIIRAESFLNVEKIIRKFKVKFLCSSIKQQALVKKLVSNCSCIHYLPFAVNSDNFYFDYDLRQKGREQLKLKEFDKIFFYSGRMSSQKNIIKLIQIFVKYLDVSSENSRLFLAGDTDDIGIPYLNKYYPSGYHNFVINHYIESLPPHVQNRITYLGSLNIEKLNMLLNASDCYISLSVHNDEDFGMAPAEALLCGLPCILTDWGGYSSFKLYDYDDCCSLVPVKIRDNSIEINSASVIKNMFYYSSKMSNKNGTPPPREKNARCYKGYLSVKAVARSLGKILEMKQISFDGFSSVMKKFNSSNVFFDPSRIFAEKITRITLKEEITTVKFSDFYKKIYSSYE